MAVRAYAVLTLPARDTVLGALSAQGCRVELVARAHQDDGLGSCYAISLHVSDVHPETAAQAQESLERRHACIITSQVDAGARTWTAVLWIPVQNVAVRTFRILEDAPPGLAPAWVVMAGGVAQVRLCPEDGPFDGLFDAVVHCLHLHGVRDVGVASLDDRRHRQQATELERMTAPLVA